jgi:SAM-dependent methyltransferase
VSLAAPSHALPGQVPEQADIETSSDAYAGRFAGPVGAFLLERQNQVILDLLAPVLPPGARVLEVGGGHAQVAPALIRAGYSVTVVGSAEVCRARLDRLRESDPGALPPDRFEYRTVDLLDLPFPDRSFDAAVSVRLLAHAGDWRRLLAEMCRVSRTAVVNDYPDTRSFNRFYDLLFEWKRSREGNTRPFRCFHPGEPAAECARHGFGRPREVRQLFVPMVLHRIVKSAAASRAVEAGSRLAGLTRLLGSPVVLLVERQNERQGESAS